MDPRVGAATWPPPGESPFSGSTVAPGRPSHLDIIKDRAIAASSSISGVQLDAAAKATLEAEAP